MFDCQITFIQKHEQLLYKPDLTVFNWFNLQSKRAKRRGTLNAAQLTEPHLSAPVHRFACSPVHTSQKQTETFRMQQIYRQSDQNFEVYTTVISPQVCRSRTRTRHVETGKVMAVVSYRARCPRELDLNQGDLIQVLYKEDKSWWFGRLTNGNKGYFPSACVELVQDPDQDPVQEPVQDCDSSRAAPTLVRRGSVPVAVMTAGAPCGCTSGLGTPKLLRKNSIRRPLSLGLDGSSAAPPHGSPSLLHRVLSKSRRKSCPHLPHRSQDGSINTGFQPD
ncbi:uncharacterized protein si:dkey-97a13.12 isoform X2 [Scomber scombrus]|uniref:Uncharacterized protein si:dkey-97a13.12 isoform X2 n=1 Tax=Scomber scombrus TaxID=13677 RepID=A0AAV1QAQ5_SCOSC